MIIEIIHFGVLYLVTVHAFKHLPVGTSTPSGTETLTHCTKYLFWDAYKQCISYARNAAVSQETYSALKELHEIKGL